MSDSFVNENTAALGVPAPPPLRPVAKQRPWIQIGRHGIWEWAYRETMRRAVHHLDAAQKSGVHHDPAFDDSASGGSASRGSAPEVRTYENRQATVL
ncbi:MAG: hypothetical protein AAFN70_09420, partial [Planctomycetota bacterium]